MFLGSTPPASFFSIAGSLPVVERHYTFGSVWVSPTLPYAGILYSCLDLRWFTEDRYHWIMRCILVARSASVYKFFILFVGSQVYLEK